MGDTAPTRVGIIGLGTVGSRFVEQFGRHDGFELVAAWDPDADACAAQRDAVSIVADASAVVDAADLVYIAVPPAAHREHVDRCLAGGAAIFCEKPLGVDVDDSRAMVAAVDDAAVPAGINFVFSAAPSSTALTEIVASGRLGEIVRADLRLHFAEWPRAWHTRAQWLRYRDEGGWMREVASHFLFLAQRVLGPPAVTSSSVMYADGADGELCEHEATAHLLAGGATPFSIAGSSGGVGPDVVDFTIRGTHAAVRITDWYRVEVSDGNAWTEVVVDDAGRGPYAVQLDEVAAMTRGEPHRIATFAEALAVQETVELILAS